MEFDDLDSKCEADEKISVSDNVNYLQHTISKSDSFVVDMEQYSHLIEKDINSKTRVTLHRSLTRKGSGERKAQSNRRDASMIATSTKATFNGSNSVPEKATVVALEGPVHSNNNCHHHHHQITITSGSVSTTASEIKHLRKKRRSLSPFVVTPRRLLFFFASLSSMGSIILIYLTLSMRTINGEDIATLD